jgi:cysteine desulfuration protein SufE
MTQFGIDTTSEDIVDALSFFDSWEDRYKYIIDLGKELPALDPSERTEEHLVRGCQSQVWLVSRKEGDRYFFEADSDAFIVKGLLAVVLAAYNGRSADDIQAFDVEAYFQSLNLMKHLSMTRGNGLRAMVKRIQDTAAAG